MTIALDGFHKLAGQVKRLEADAERAKGALQADLDALKREFEVGDVKSALRSLKAIRNEEEELREEYARLKEEFETQFPTLFTEES